MSTIIKIVLGVLILIKSTLSQYVKELSTALQLVINMVRL